MTQASQRIVDVFDDCDAFGICRTFGLGFRKAIMVSGQEYHCISSPPFEAGPGPLITQDPALPPTVGSAAVFPCRIRQHRGLAKKIVFGGAVGIILSEEACLVLFICQLVAIALDRP
jgi:hypothetical protein